MIRWDDRFRIEDAMNDMHTDDTPEQAGTKPVGVTPEQDEMNRLLDEALAARQYPTNTMNAARAGWYAHEKFIGTKPAEPNNDEVICPKCAHQFRAIPVNVQSMLRAAGHEPPYLKPSPEPAEPMQLSANYSGMTDPPLGKVESARDIVQTIALAMKNGYTPDDILDENSPIAERIWAEATAIRAALKPSPEPAVAEPTMFDALGEPRTRYVRVTLGDVDCVMHPSEGDAYLKDAKGCGDDGAYVLTNVYISEREFEDLPEFDGF